MLNDAFRKKLDVFRNPGVRALLERGRDKALIKELLDSTTSEALQEFFLQALRKSPGLPEIINKYMKPVIVKRVKIADFKPTTATIQKDQIAGVTEEFGKFLETYFTAEPGDENILPVLQLE